MISTSKLTGRTLVAARHKYAQNRAKVKTEGDHGKMSVEKLIRKDQGVQQIDIAKSGIRDFERVLNRYSVDYAICKDVSQDPPRFMVFFKARDADVLTAAFKEYFVSTSSFSICCVRKRMTSTMCGSRSMCATSLTSAPISGRYRTWKSW